MHGRSRSDVFAGAGGQRDLSKIPQAFFSAGCSGQRDSPLRSNRIVLHSSSLDEANELYQSLVV